MPLYDARFEVGILDTVHAGRRRSPVRLTSRRPKLLPPTIMLLSEPALDLLFRHARTHTHWLARPLDEATLRALYDLMKWGPTSANCSPARIVFVCSREAKERLRPSQIGRAHV